MENDYLIDVEVTSQQQYMLDITIVKEYDPEYCKLIIEHCMNGRSVESFSGKEFIDTDVLAHWSKVHEDFKAASKIAIAAEYGYWENEMLKALNNPEYAYKLPSINRRLSELGNILMKNGLRKSMYNNFDDSPSQSAEEKLATQARNNFIEE